tara:strand:- start:248 stop:493 length:246 start_codon:yes stop_codon:yes gene_type:complete
MPLSLWLEYPAKGRGIYRINTNRKQCKQQIFRQRFDDNFAPISQIIRYIQTNPKKRNADVELVIYPQENRLTILRKQPDNI